jgi:hypothetical protein
MPSLKGSANPSYKHGYANRGKRPAIYIRFRNIVARCHQVTNKDYPKYGGKGISVCDRWRKGDGELTGFECFIADMGEPPQGMSLDRIDNSKGYSPENCRWVNAQQQANNRKSNHILEIDGVCKTLAEWSRVSGVGSKTILHRLKHQGLSPKEAVFNKLTWTKRSSKNGNV